MLRPNLVLVLFVICSGPASRAHHDADAEPSVAEKERQRLQKRLTDLADQPDSERVSAAEVRRVFGTPQQMARQILYQRYLDQWLYEAPTGLRLGFDGFPGQPPRLIAVERVKAVTRP